MTEGEHAFFTELVINIVDALKIEDGGGEEKVKSEVSIQGESLIDLILRIARIESIGSIAASNYLYTKTLR